MLIIGNFMDQRIINRQILLIALDFLLLKSGAVVVAEDPDIDQNKKNAYRTIGIDVGCDRVLIDNKVMKLKKQQNEQQNQITVDHDDPKWQRSIFNRIKEIFQLCMAQ